MTDPNQFSHTDTLAARKLVKSWNNPAHWNAIDRGEWDQWGAMEKARAQVIRERSGAEGEPA